jgi:uncharacterized protein involved in cysteine biosynthesis
MGLIADVGRSVAQLTDPRFLGVLLKALLLTMAALAAVFWVTMLGLGWLLPDSVTLPWVGQVGFVDDLLSWAAIGLMLVLSVVLMVPVAAVVVGFFLDDIAAAVEARHYPGLPAVSGLGIGDTLVDSLGFLGVVVAANLAALLLYLLLPPFAPMIFWLVYGYLLGREYFQLVAARRLGRKGATALRRRHRGRIWMIGTAMAVPLSLPLVNLVVPIIGVAVFTHQFHRLADRP